VSSAAGCSHTEFYGAKAITAAVSVMPAREGASAEHPPWYALAPYRHKLAIANLASTHSE